MATTYVPDLVSRAGVQPTVNTPVVSGDKFPAGPNIYLRFITSGTTATVTITPPAGSGPLGETVAPKVLPALPATGVREYGPWPQQPYGDQSGLVSIGYSSVTGLTVECKNYSG